MSLFRFPVLLWRDFEGFYNAAAVEWDDDLTGCDRKPSIALKQLKQWLEWEYKEKPWLGPPDFLDPQLTNITVNVRPQYKHDGRLYACDDLVEVKVVCVHGRQSGGIRLCSLPTLGVRFHYYDEKSLKKLVTEAVRHRLAEMPPAEIARFLPANQAKLEEVNVRTDPRERHHQAPAMVDALKQVAEPLGASSMQRRYVRAWQRERDIGDLSTRLTQQRANVAITGEAGSGKSTVLAATARNIERLSDTGFRYRFWLTSAARLIAGMRYLGEWEQRAERVVDELAAFDGILCVDNLLELVRQGGRDATDSLAAFFLPFLNAGELRIVGELTPATLDATRRLLPGFADAFQVLEFNEMDAPTAREALAQLAAQQGKQQGVSVTEPAIHTTHRLFKRFMPYQAMPGSATPFVANLIELARQFDQKEIDTPEVLDEFVQKTGLPELFIRDEQVLEYEQLLTHFSQCVIGQPQGAAAAATVAATFKAGLNSPGKPVGVLLFCGPTGVGKTEMAKALCGFLFGHGKSADRLIRLDMSEYSGWDAAHRLLMKPDGTASDFIDKVRAQPFVVVLFDEIEKAHSDVFDMLLGLLDEGRLTDQYGRTTNFESAIVIMTSNLGVTGKASVGFDGDQQQGFDREVRAFFRPEFFNRIDSVVTFQPLSREVCEQIVEKQLTELALREGFARRGLTISYDAEVTAMLVESGFDPRYGARPLLRAIEQKIAAPLARFLVAQPKLTGAALRLSLQNDAVIVHPS